LYQIGRLIVTTPANELVSDMEQAALKIQKIYRGSAARKEVHERRVAGSMEETRALAARAAARYPTSQSITVGSAKPSAQEQETAANKCVRSGGIPKMVMLFSSLDSSGDGQLQIEEFVSGIEQLPILRNLEVEGRTLNHDDFMQVARSIDRSGNGTINYLEFLQAFESTGTSDIMDTLGEDISTVLFRHRLAIRMGCHYLDEEGTGLVRAEDFKQVLNGVNSALARPERTLTNTQISLLTECLITSDTLDSESVVSYDALLRSFAIMDTKDKTVLKRL